MRLPFFMLTVWLAATAFAQTRLIPHVTRVGGGFSTTVIVENQSVTSKSFTFSAFDSAGNALTPHEGNLDGLSVSSTTVADLFQDSENVSHFLIDAPDDIKVSVAYNFELGNGSPAHVRDTDQQAKTWRVFPGDWALVFDGLALVNLGAEATDVQVIQKDFAGNTVQTVTVVEGLAPNGKALYVIGSPDGSAFTARPDSYYELSAGQNLAVTALRGTLGRQDVGLLWANRALPLSEDSAGKTASTKPSGQ